MIPLVLVALHTTPGLHLWWIPRCKSEDEATQLPHMFERSSHCLARAAETASISNNASVFRPSSLLATRTWVLAFVILQLCFTLVPSFSGSPPPPDSETPSTSSSRIRPCMMTRALRSHVMNPYQTWISFLVILSCLVSALAHRSQSKLR